MIRKDQLRPGLRPFQQFVCWLPEGRQTNSCRHCKRSAVDKRLGLLKRSTSPGLIRCGAKMKDGLLVNDAMVGKPSGSCTAEQMRPLANSSSDDLSQAPRQIRLDGGHSRATAGTSAGLACWQRGSRKSGDGRARDFR